MKDKFLDLIRRSAEREVIRKLVFSRPTNRDEASKVSVRAVCHRSQRFFAIEYTKGDTVAQKNVKFEEGYALFRELLEGYMQVNLLTSVGDAEYKSSKSGKSVLLGEGALVRRLEGDLAGFAIAPESLERQKSYILKGDEPFLRVLGISDKNGRVHDKKQAKFRQINRFLELIRDVEGSLPESGTLRICDLCCGKSYLSFAVYHYFAVIKNREVKMTGVDLKRDVIEYCSGVAKSLGFDGLEFLCGDVSLYNTEEQVNMVISLHACDIATDIVIEKAIEWQADVILSTPCCHHDLNKRLNCEPLAFIADYSMLRQKLCDAATDALRLKLMEANGYDTAALELIDPEETPKNIMLRGIRKRSFDKNSEKAKRLLAEYEKAYAFLVGNN